MSYDQGVVLKFNVLLKFLVVVKREIFQKSALMQQDIAYGSCTMFLLRPTALSHTVELTAPVFHDEIDIYSSKQIHY